MIREKGTVHAAGLAGLKDLLELVGAATGLDEDQAKTLVYWAVGTHKLPDLDTFPILAFQGPPGTGKSTLLRILGHLTHRPKSLDGGITDAELRDSLESDATALLEEADNVRERRLLSRYSRQTSRTSVKRKTGDEWRSERLNLFGATALHRRVPFRDPAVLSRSIVVKTRKASVAPHHAEDFAPYAAEVQALASDIAWETDVGDGSGRISDTWGPLLMVASGLGDEDWLSYAHSEMKRAEADLDAGRDEEPAQIVYQALLALAVEDLPEARLEMARERVLLNDVVKSLDGRDQNLNSWQVGSLLRDMGFATTTVGGKQYVYVGGADRLRTIGHQLGVQDEMLSPAE